MVDNIQGDNLATCIFTYKTVFKYYPMNIIGHRQIYYLPCGHEWKSSCV